MKRSRLGVALGLFGLSLALNLVYFAQFSARNPFAKYLVVDSYRYDQLARELLAHGFRSEGVFYQAPLYPYFVAMLYTLFGSSHGLVALIQVVLAAFIPVLLWRIGTRAIGEGAGLAAGLLALLYGPLWAFAPRLLPAVPVVLLQLLFLAFVPEREETRPRRWVLPGLLLGLLCIARPTHLLLLAWLGGAVLLRRLPPRAGATALGVALLVIAPVTIHNLAADGSLTLVSSNSGENFAHGNNKGARGGFALIAGLPSADILRQEEVSRQVAEQELGRSLRGAEVQRYWFRRGLKFIRENPGRYAWLELQKLRLLLGAEETPDLYSPKLEARLYTPFLRVAFLSALLVLPFAVAGAWSARRRLPHWFWGLLLVEIVTALAFYVNNRYRLSWEVLLLVPAGASLVALRNRATWGWLGGGIALAVLLHVTADRTRQSEGWGIILTNLGTSLARAQEYPEAQEAFRSAVELAPSWARSHHYLGRSLVRQERLAEAVGSLQRALELDPNLAEARLDLAGVYLRLANPAAARRELAQIPGKGPIAPETAQGAARMCAALAEGWLQLGDCENSGTVIQLAHQLTREPPAELVLVERIFAEQCP